ncbi:hypothetical protein CLIB1423_18S02498 [[Candida] railenensis]|uniref:RRM domain-containing protein n=1 Tax=[Candida] railenensis TaxID=45579 RepID=A0A9P0QTP3_9ASCO|nr:hypothetical protein CLIB1423_18S02498 [[Candida] railenensis]
MSSKGSDFPIVLVKNLPYSTSSDSLFNLFSKYGNIHQIRVPDQSSSEPAPAGSCFVIYRNIEAAHQASKRINGINFEGRYLVASIYNVDKAKLSHEDFITRRDELERLKEEYGLS